MELRDRLEELMSEYGLKTQQQLADFAGVSKGLVGQWFNGLTGLGAKPLAAFVDILPSINGGNSYCG